MTDRFDAQVRQAQWAVRRWEGFPVGALSRPLVLVSDEVLSRRGFRSDAAKLAFSRGLIAWAVEVPDKVRSALRSRDSQPQAKGPGDEVVDRAEQPLRITHAGRGEHEFLTDRGAVMLSAWWVRGPGTVGPIWVLDPEVERWRPPADGGGAPPSAPTQGQPLLWPIEVAADGRSLVIPWLGSPAVVETFPRVKLIQTPTAVSAVEVRKDMGFEGWVTAVGVRHEISARLRAPQGARVFVDLHGHAMQVISRA